MTSTPPGQDRDRLNQALNALAAAFAAGRHGEAAAQAEALLSAGLRHPLPLRIAATGRLRAGRFEEAVALAKAWIQLSPRDPAAWSALAQGQAAARRPLEALEAADRALALAPDDAGLICRKAEVLHGLSRTTEAAALFHQALVLDPKRYEARFGLAQKAAEDGDWDEAQAQIDALDAAAPPPNLIWLKARIALGQDRPGLAKTLLDPLCIDETLPAEQRANALLLSGEAQDALGQPSAAFAAAQTGKALLHQFYAQRAQSRESETGKLNRLTAWFRAADPAPWRTAPPEAPAHGQAASHVFLVGFPRSGTTLLEQVLAGHPQVSALEEAPTLATAYAEFLSSPEGLERLAALPPDEAQTWRARYWAEVAQWGGRAPGKLFLDKAPAETLSLPLIAKLFPRAKVLFALRDPRDVVLSCLRSNFQMNAMTYAFTTLEETAACYAACMALAEVYRAVLPLDLTEARHETLIDDFDGELGRIAAFLGLEIDPAMADVAATARRRTVRTPSAGQVRAGLNRQGLGRWRAYKAELSPILHMLAPWVERFGYAAT